MGLIAAAPLLASGASAVAGTTASGGLVLGSVVSAAGPTLPTAFISGTTLSSISTGVSLASQLFSGIQSFQQADAAAEAQEIASEQRAAEIRLQSQAESTRQAQLDLERQRRLRRTIASQRAATAGVVSETGSILNIQQQTASQIQREGRLSEFQTDLNINALTRQALSETRAGQNLAIGTRSRARTSLLSVGTDVARGTQGLLETIK